MTMIAMINYDVKLKSSQMIVKSSKARLTTELTVKRCERNRAGTLKKEKLSSTQRHSFAHTIKQASSSRKSLSETFDVEHVGKQKRNKRLE